MAPPDADPYGKRRAVVVCVSGSFGSSRSWKAPVPCALPSRAWRRARRSAFWASVPPPLPKIEPMKAATAMTSLRSHGWASGAPVWREPGGDPLGVGVEVREHLLALGAVGGDELLLLGGHEILGLLAREVDPSAGDERERVHARDVGHRGARRVAAEPEQQAAVLGRHKSGAEPGVRARLAVDVRNPEGVAQDLEARAPGVLGRRGADRLEVLGLEEAEDVRLRDVAAQRGERVVGRDLVGRVVRRRYPPNSPGGRTLRAMSVRASAAAGETARSAAAANMTERRRRKSCSEDEGEGEALFSTSASGESHLGLDASQESARTDVSKVHPSFVAMSSVPASG